MTVHVISDLHFNHTNIIKYTGRPFKDVPEMNEVLIRNWNAVVGPDDFVYCLGDFAFGSTEKWHSILDRLQGRVALIRGNHDHKPLRQDPRLKERFVWIKDYHEESIEGQFVVMSHFPILEWNRCQSGSFMLAGHCHGNRDSENANVRRLDVGVDSFCKKGYAPRSWKEVKAELDPKPFQPHHNREE